jgi:hypothetical protein
MELGRSRRTLMMMLLRPPAARFSYGASKTRGIERTALTAIIALQFASLEGR